MNLIPKKIQQWKSHMNVQNQLETIEVSALISCIASICYVYFEISIQN